MHLLVEWQDSREIIEWEDTLQEEFIDKVRQVLNISVDRVILQKFDEAWDAWVNMKIQDALQDKMKLKCVIKPCSLRTRPDGGDAKEQAPQGPQ